MLIESQGHCNLPAGVEVDKKIAEQHVNILNRPSSLICEGKTSVEIKSVYQLSLSHCSVLFICQMLPIMQTFWFGNCRRCHGKLYLLAFQTFFFLYYLITEVLI